MQPVQLFCYEATSISDLCCALQHIDNLAREKAFFVGPPPLLLSSLSPDDLTFLLLGSDPKTSQVEFGAHQVCSVLDWCNM